MVESPVQRRQDLIARFPEWRQRTLAAHFDHIAAAFPGRPAIITANQNWSYHQLHATSKTLASALIALGLEAGDRIALLMPNCPEFVAIKLAIARIGGIAVPVNYQLRQEELRYILGQSECAALFAMAAFRGRDYIDDLLDLRRNLPQLRHTIVQTPATSLPGGLINLADLPGRTTPASDQLLAARQASLSAHDCSDIIYTSGTTGSPKGAMLTHDMALRAGFSSALTRSFEDARRIQFALPLYHVFGYVECWVAALFVGGAIIPHEQFDAGEMLDWAETLGSTDIVCVPVMTQQLVDAARARGFRAPALLAFFNSGGATWPGVWHDIRAILGAREVHTAYGMTETTASTMCTLSEDGVDRLVATNGCYKLAGPAGDPALGGLVAQYRVVGPATGAALPLDTDGELQVRGPVVTRGYFRKPAETAAAFTTDGWFRTGDLGRLLDGGYVRLTGRLKETYRCGGEMVSPGEIEALLGSYPGIARVFAVGVPDARMGEVGCLLVVARPGHVLDDAAIIRHCAQHLARFKIPQYVVAISEADIPLTATGRPQKFRLAQLARERLGLTG